MRCYLLLLVLLLAGQAVFAQDRPPVSQPDSAVAGVPAPAAPDTVAALHRLFADRRRRRNFIVGYTGVVTLGAIVASGAETSNSSIVPPAAVATIFGILGGVAVAGELAFFSKYSRQKEQRTVDDFQAHRLDWGLRRKLKPRHFR